MNSCDATQRRLAEEGAEFLQHDAEAARHVGGCADCTRFLVDLERLEATLGAMPAHDAPDALVADTLSAVRAAGPIDQRPARPSPRRLRLAGALAASVVIAATIGLTHNLVQSPDYQTTYGDSVADAPAAITGPTDGKYDQSAGSVSLSSNSRRSSKRWLPGMTRVAPFSSVKSVIAQSVLHCTT